MEVNKIIQGDCLEVLKTIPNNSIDTIITDPPYGLAFMGKEWDNFGTDLQKYQEWTRQWATEALRVAKPGATLLCFGGTRTFHRLTCGLEDAGWQIKDVLMWLYGSGFPKSLNIGKSLIKQIEEELKKQGVQEVIWK
jgi:site-specific DNA-methyltransferase (adenine-specific)